MKFLPRRAINMRRLILLFSAFLAVNSYANPLESKRTFKNVGGLIDHISPFLTPDGNASEIQNITMDDRGLLSKRTGYTVIDSTYALMVSSFSVASSSRFVNGGTYHTATSGNSFFTVIAGTDVYRIGNTFSSYSKITGTLSLTNSASNLAQATHLQDRAVFCNESDKPFYIQATGNATQISTSTFTAAKTCTTYGVYLVVGNTTESAISYPSRVRWSDINDINSFPALNYIDVEPDDGDKIVGVISFDESVYIFKHRSIYRMLITGLDGPDAFIIRPVSRNIGSWAKNSIRVIPNVGIAFLAQNTAYLLSDSGLNPIGDPIQRTFDSVSRAMWPYAVAEVYPKKYQYWLAVSTANSINSEVLIYDYVQNNWTIYNNMTIQMLAQAEDSTGQNILISGDQFGVTYKQDNGSTDNARGSSSTIVGFYTTANLYTMETPDITKGFKYLYVYTVGDQNYTLNVKAAYDFSTTYEYDQDITVGSASALYDTGVYDTDIYPASGYTVTRLELNRVSRSIRLKFSNTTSGEIFGLLGWTIVFDNEDYRQ